MLSSSNTIPLSSKNKAEAIRYFNEFKSSDDKEGEKIEKAAALGHAEARRLLAQEYHQFLICRSEESPLSLHEASFRARRWMCSLLEEKPHDFGDSKPSPDEEKFYLKHDKYLFSTAFCVTSHPSMRLDSRLHFSLLVALPHSEEDSSLQNLLTTITDETLKLDPNAAFCKSLRNMIRPVTAIFIDYYSGLKALRYAIGLVNANTNQLTHYITERCNEGHDGEKIIRGLLRFMSLQCRTIVRNNLSKALAEAVHPRIDSGVSACGFFLPRGIASLITSYGSHNENIDLVLSYLNSSCKEPTSCMSP